MSVDEVGFWFLAIGWVVAIVMVLLYLKERKRNLLLEQILATKEATIANLQAGRAAVQEALSDTDALGAIAKAHREGKDAEAIAEALDMPIAKVKTAIKLIELRKLS